jgi:hypothetical protein
MFSRPTTFAGSARGDFLARYRKTTIILWAGPFSSVSTCSNLTDPLVASFQLLPTAICFIIGQLASEVVGFAWTMFLFHLLRSTNTILTQSYELKDSYRDGLHIQSKGIPANLV